MSDAGFKGTDIKKPLSPGRENSRSFRLPKSDIPSVPESRIKPGNHRPT